MGFSGQHLDAGRSKCRWTLPALRVGTGGVRSALHVYHCPWRFRRANPAPRAEFLVDAVGQLFDALACRFGDREIKGGVAN